MGDREGHPEDVKKSAECAEYVRGLGKNDNFFLYCSINIPHPAFNTNQTWLDMVNVDKIDVPKWLPLDSFHPYDYYMSATKNVLGNYTNEDFIKLRKAYFGMCAEADHLLGEVMAALKERDDFEQTYIMYISDHGEMNLEHRQIWKNSMYEASSRVPMMISGPGIPKGVVIKNLTS